MTPHKQKFKHDPENGVYGDCHRTVIACLLDKADPDEVPHIGAEQYADVREFNKHFDDYLHTQGLCQVYIPFESTLERLLECAAVWFPNAYYILSGESRTGVNHSVVACGAEIVWDPSPNDAGIVGPCDDGFYWVTYFTPLYRKE